MNFKKPTLLLKSRIPIGDDNQLANVVIPSADEENSPIAGNVKRKTLSNGSFDDLRYLSGLSYDQVRTMFADFGDSERGVVALVEEGVSILLPNRVAAVTWRNGDTGSRSRIWSSKHPLRAGLPC